MGGAAEWKQAQEVHDSPGERSSPSELGTPNISAQVSSFTDTERKWHPLSLAASPRSHD